MILHLVDEPIQVTSIKVQGWNSKSCLWFPHNQSWKGWKGWKGMYRMHYTWSNKHVLWLLH